MNMQEWMLTAQASPRSQTDSAQPASPGPHDDFYFGDEPPQDKPEPLSLPSQPPPAQTNQPQTAPEKPLSFLTPGGTLSIPFDSDPKYHWWNGGQSVKETLAEVQARIAASRS